MIDLYYWPTPNGHKITVFCEEAGLDYRLRPVNIGKGDQFEPDYLKISPNNKMPAIVDHAPADEGEPISVFESGVILQYLADKTGRFLPRVLRERLEVLQWLTWQVAGVGPMIGQYHHFKDYADQHIPYAVKRYGNETTRLHKVLDRQLEGRDYITGEYSIADMAVYPWMRNWRGHDQDLQAIPRVAAWLERMGQRPAVQRAYARADDVDGDASMSDAAKKVLFGQTDSSRPE